MSDTLHDMIRRVVWAPDLFDDPSQCHWEGLAASQDDVEALRRVIPRPGEPLRQGSVARYRVDESIGVHVRYYVAIDHETGICTCGRPTRELAEEDARALNAAYELGRQAGLMESKE